MEIWLILELIMVHSLVAATHLCFLQTETTLKTLQLVISSERQCSAESCILTIDLQYHFHSCLEKKGRAHISL